MTQLETIQEHHRLCDEIHLCVQEENRFLRTQQRAPDAALLERKRSLLDRLDASLEALRTVPAASVRDPETRAALDKSRARILQILQLDRENEQLLLRSSLGAAKPAGAAPAPSVALLQKIYARSS
ncbi:MAG: hypothetical protein JNL39_02770 [Opitutaceae bacterium]|nr:hypothetical protein [Opitutaceae bacterium]